MSTSRVQKSFVNSALQLYKKHSNSNLPFSGSNNFHKKAITLSDKCVTTFFYYLQNHLKIGKICFCWFRFQQTLFSSLWKQVYLVILKAFFIMFVCSRWLWSLAAILLRTKRVLVVPTLLWKKISFLLLSTMAKIWQWKTISGDGSVNRTP